MQKFRLFVWRNGKFAAVGQGFRRNNGEVMIAWPGFAVLAGRSDPSDPAAVAESARAEEAIEAAVANGESEVVVDGVVYDLMVD